MRLVAALLVAASPAAEVEHVAGRGDQVRHVRSESTRHRLLVLLEGLHCRFEIGRHGTLHLAPVEAD